MSAVDAKTVGSGARGRIAVASMVGTTVGGADPVPLGRRLQRHQPARQQLLGHRVAGDHLEPAAPLGAQRRQSGVDALRDVKHLIGPFGDDLACRRQLGTPGRARHQAHADLGLDRGQPRRDGLLTGSHFTARRVQTARLGDRGQHFECGEFGHPGA